mgnify:FL=1
MTPHRALPYPTAVPERSLLGAWCERNFLKRRLVLALDAPTRSAPSLDLYELSGYGAGSGREMPATLRRSLAQAIGEERLARRLADPDLALFVAAAPDGAAAGFVWGLAPERGTAWHDNVPVRAGTALLFHGYVLPEHRRHGLFTALIVAVQDYFVVGLGRARVFGVVESGNIPSLRTLRSLGYQHLGDNFLLKVLGVNVVSVLRWRDPPGTEAHLVFMSPRGHSC